MAPGPVPYFFLSYAHGDREDGEPGDGYIPLLYRHLSNAVARRVGADPADVGFIDTTGIRLGNRWTSALARAVSTCRVFVALCSPRYYSSEYCAEEWNVFHRRCVVYKQYYGNYPDLLFPLMWVRVERVPEVVGAIQWSDSGLGETYASGGLRYLMHLDRHGDDYRTFIESLAHRIHQAAETIDLPHAPLAGSSVPEGRSAAPGFAEPRQPPERGLWRPSDVTSSAPRGGPNPAQGPVDQPDPADPDPADQPDPAAEPARTGGATGGGLSVEPAAPAGADGGEWIEPVEIDGQHVVFAIVAATESELTGVRTERGYYGTRSYHWAPFRPESGGSIFRSAQRVASAHDFVSRLAEASVDLAALSEEADEDNEIVVIIVDLWTAELEPYRTALSRYDRFNATTSAVMIPRSERDAETRTASPRLDMTLAQVFRKNVVKPPGDALFQRDLRSEGEFRARLTRALVEAYGRVQRGGEIRRQIGGSGYPEPPTLDGP
jgi:FxsC-like protein